MRFSDRDSIKKYICDLSIPIDTSCYPISYNELMECATDNYIDYLKAYGFVYGETDINDIPLSDEDFWAFFE